jgi:hypothetical protein
MRDLGEKEAGLPIVRADNGGVGDDEQNMLGHGLLLARRIRLTQG